MSYELELKLSALRRLYREKKIDDVTYTDAVLRIIGVKP